jgi:hypothetical protein
VRTRDAREHEVARDVHLFGDRGVAGQPEPRRHGALVHHAARDERAIFRVRHHGRVDELRVLEHAAHHVAVHDRLAVVAERDRARRQQRGHLGHHLALEALGGRGDRVHAHGRILSGAIDDVVGGGGVVIDGLGVGHARDRREAARGRRAPARADALLVLLARLAQVAVQVDEARRHPAAGRLDHERVVDAQLPADRRDPAVCDQEIADLVALGRRVEHARSAHEDLRHASPPLADDLGARPANR